MQPYARTTRTLARIFLRNVVQTCARAHKRPDPVALPCSTVVRRRRRSH